MRRASPSRSTPVQEPQATEAHRFGERLCCRTDVEWAAAQADDTLAALVIKYVSRPDDSVFPAFTPLIVSGVKSIWL